MFRKLKITAIAVLAATSFLFAEAYQVNTLSARQLGMGHTGAGQKLGVESMHFNPGGLGFLENKFEASAGVTFIMPRVELEGTWGEQRAEKGVATPMYVYAGSNFLPFMSAGLSFTTPYGNSASWDKNWAGAELIQDISLKVFALQPTVAFNIMKIVSIGVGPTINFGNFEQSKALAGPGAFNDYGALAAGIKNVPFPGLSQASDEISSVVNKYAEKSAASITLSGDAKPAVGVHAGIMVDIIEKIGIGVSYRSGVKAKVKGGKVEITKNADDINRLNEAINTANNSMNTLVELGALPGWNNAPNVVIPPLDKGTFDATLPLPENMNIGVSFKPTDKLLFALDLQLIGWGAYDSLIMTFNDVGGVAGNDVPKNAAKKYEDAAAIRFGTQIGLTEMVDLRAGIYFDGSPVPDDFLNPETPSTNKLGGTLGCSIRPIKMLSIDLGLLYVHSIDGTNSYRSGSVVKDNGQKFAANYTVQAIAPSIGISLKF